MFRPKLVSLLVLLCVNTFVYAQLSISVPPKSDDVQYNNLVEQSVPEMRLATPDLTEVREEDEAQDQAGIFPWRFAVSQEVNYTMDNSGEWTVLPNEAGRVWRLKITSPGAVSLNLLYKEFYLPKGATYHVYTPEKKQVLGAFTSYNNKSDRVFATALTEGESVIVEYFEPVRVSSEGVIHIGTVNHGYRGFGENNSSTGSSGSCQNDVNCTSDPVIQRLKTAVGKWTLNGSAWCTGTLVNNTNQDCRPLFLTADHCIDAAGAGNRDAISNPGPFNTDIFYWNFETPGCNLGQQGDASQTTVGTNLVLANPNSGSYSASSDFALFELTENPADAYNVYFAGWDTLGNTSPGGFGIHHPAGDVKKISIHSLTPASAVSDRYWRVNPWDEFMGNRGVTEGGSSGSALFKNNGRIIGQLFGSFTGINPNCSDPINDTGDYGKLAYSWTNNGATDSRRRLFDHLDPAGAGTTTTIAGSYRPCMTAVCRDITVDLGAYDNVVIDAEDIDNGSTATAGIDTYESSVMSVNCADAGSVVPSILTVTDNNGVIDTCIADISVINEAPVFNAAVGALDITVMVGPEVTDTVTFMRLNGCFLSIRTPSPGDENTLYGDTLMFAGTNIQGEPVNPAFRFGFTFDQFMIMDGGVPSDTVFNGLTGAFDCDFSGGCIATDTFGLTVTDRCGERSAEYQVVLTFIDSLPPVAQCQDITVALDDVGSTRTLLASEVDDASYSNCYIVDDVSVAPNMFDCNDAGNNMVVLTVTDDKGDTDTCHANVFVGTDMDGDGYFAECDDCNDLDSLINPGVPEKCGDGIDNNCDGVTDDVTDFGYCCATGTNINSYIDQVSFSYPIGNVLRYNPTGSQIFGYGNYTDPPVVVPGSNVPHVYFNVVPGLNRFSYIRIWVDWNNSGTFDPFEMMAQNITNAAWNGQISVPYTLRNVPGEYVVRIGLSQRGYINDPCGESQRAEFEDYILCIGGGCDGGAMMMSFDPEIAGEIPGNGIVWNVNARPNPFDDMLSVEMITQSAGDLDLQVFDQQGRLVSQQTISGAAGMNQLEIQTDHWSTGMYYLRVVSDHGLKVLKLVKD